MKTSRWLPALGLAVLLLGCAARNPIVSEWSNPSYTFEPVRSVLVGGSGEDTSVRRNFEDEFVAQLRAAGVDARPSYRLVPESAKIDEARLKDAARRASLDGVLFARLVQVEQKTEYGPGLFPYTSFGIFGSNVAATWYGLGGAPSVTRYNEYVSETTLYDVRKNDVVWTATIRTTEPENVRSGIRSYVEAVLKALQEKNLVRERAPM